MSKTVLVVDDSKVARLIFKKVIQAVRPDWSIDEAGNGDEALQLFSQNSYAMLFIDVNMLGMDGLEVSGKIREADNQIPVCLVTANVQDSIKAEAQNLKLSVIGKPLSEEKFTKYLEELGEF